MLTKAGSCGSSGKVAAHQAETDVAEGRYRESLMLADRLGMRPLQAHCHLGLGKLHRHLGRLDAARDELTRAVSMLREMGMTRWLRRPRTSSRKQKQRSQKSVSADDRRLPS